MKRVSPALKSLGRYVAVVLVAFALLAAGNYLAPGGEDPDQASRGGFVDAFAQLALGRLKANDAPGHEREIVCWGDSMVAGVGTSTLPLGDVEGYPIGGDGSFPNVLASLTGHPTYNFGISGATSAEIVGYQQGAIDIAPEGAMAVDEPEAAATADEPEGAATSDEPDIADAATGIRLTRPQIALLAPEHPGDVLILEIGSNGGWEQDYDILISQYRAMIDFAGTDEYIIVGDTDDPGTSLGDPVQLPFEEGEGPGETAWEAALREEFGEHFLNTRVYLIEHGLEVCDLEPTEVDETDATYGLISVRLRYDWTHLNAYGYYAKARGVYELGRELGYWR